MIPYVVPKRYGRPLTCATSLLPDRGGQTKDTPPPRVHPKPSTSAGTGMIRVEVPAGSSTCFRKEYDMKKSEINLRPHEVAGLYICGVATFRQSGMLMHEAYE